MSKSKIKTSFFCQSCGHNAPKWLGKCPSCGQWNTFVEEILKKENENSNLPFTSKTSRIQVISEIEIGAEHRILLPDLELNRVLGGGLVPGSIILFGGEPGIGKSTLLLQIALGLKK